nr:reverse transcriptase domain-containing protein [Tanacetum cinerariifolium]
MEELCQPSLNGRGGPIAPIAIQETNFGLKNDMIQQVQNSCQFHGLPDTFYNGLTLRHRDTINAAARGTFMKRRPEECSITSSSDTEIAALKAEMAKINKNLMRVLLINQQVKAVTPNCETCGGPHSFSDCPTIVGQTQDVYAAGAYQGNSYQPQGNGNLLSYRSDNYLGPPGFNQNQNRNNQNQNFHNQNKNQGNHNPQENNQANDAILKNMQTNMTSLKNSNLELKNMFGQFMKMNTSSTLGSRTVPGNTITNPKEDLKGIITRSGTAYPGPMIPTTSSFLVVELNSPIIEPIASPVSAPRPNQRPLIPYPSRLEDLKLRDKDNDQREKFFQIFKDLNFNISFADALILMPKFGPSIKSLLTNKDKLYELARTPLNEHCLMVLLKKRSFLKTERALIDVFEDLPPHLEYTFLEGDDKLPVILAKDLSVEEKTALITVLKSHKQAIAWKLFEIKGINPEFCTHKILIEEDFEPAVQHQRRVNPKIHDVIKNEVMLKYGVTHRLSTAYHPQTSGQVEVSNRGLKRILERTIGENRASWLDKLDDALWAFRIAYKTPIGCTPYKLVYGKACHLSIELEHKAYWALKQANFDLTVVGDNQKIQLNELNEIRDHAYENSLIYKEKTKRIHDSKIKNHVFNVGDRVLLFNSRLKIFLGKLKTRWSGPFTIANVFPYGTVELSQANRSNFNVNGHRVKHYFGGDIPQLDYPDCEIFHALSFLFTRASHPQLQFRNPVSKSYRLTFSFGIPNKRL